MADNSSIPVASGNETFANDDIAGVKYPRPKINWGPDGTANDVDVASGKPLPVQLRGSDGADRSNSLPVTVSSIAAGTNNIGDVDVLTVPTDPFGANADAASATGSISAKLRFIAATGIPVTSIAAGTNNIGDVDVLTVPTDPFGANADSASATGSISAKLRGIATALGVTAFDLGSGTGGSRTLRTILDTTQVASVLDCSTTVTRPADTNAYTANDAFSNSTSAPTAGGFTFTSAAAVSGGGGIITDAIIVASAGTLYQGEIWLFDSAATAINDNAAFTLSDSDALLALGKIPFTLAVEATNNSSAHVTGLNIGFHCVGSANLRFLIKILNAPTPGNAETLTVRIKGIRS